MKMRPTEPREETQIRDLSVPDAEKISGGSAVLVGIGPVVIAAGAAKKGQN